MARKGDRRDEPLYVESVTGAGADPASNVTVQGTNPDTALVESAGVRDKRQMVETEFLGSIVRRLEGEDPAAAGTFVQVKVNAAGELLVETGLDISGLATEATLGTLATNTTAIAIRDRLPAALHADGGMKVHVTNPAGASASQAADFDGALVLADGWTPLNAATHATNPLSTVARWLILNRGPGELEVGFGADRPFITLKPDENVAPAFSGIPRVRAKTSTTANFEAVAFGET